MASPPIPEETRADQTAPQRSGSPIASPAPVDINLETGKRQEENFQIEVESMSHLAGPFSRFSLNDDRSQRSDTDENNSEKEEQRGDTPVEEIISIITQESEPPGAPQELDPSHSDEPIKEWVRQLFREHDEKYERKFDALEKRYEAQLKQKEKALEECEQKIEELKKENEELRAQTESNEQLKKENEELKAQAESTAEKLQTKTREASELNEELTANKKELREQLIRKEKLEKELENLKITLSEVEQERAKAAKKLSKTKKKLDETSQDLAEQKKQVNMLGQIMQHMEGQNEMLKEIHEDGKDQHKKQMKEIQDGVKGIREDIKANRTYEVNFSSKYWGLDEQECTKFNGEDVLIAVLDTGVNEHHKALQRAGAQSCPVVIDKRNFVTEKNGECKRDACKDTHENSHGTSVAGVVAGSHLSIAHYPKLEGKYRYVSSKNELFNLPLGVAPKASLLVCRVANGNAAPEYVAAALEWIHDHNSIVKGDVEMTAAHEECKLSHDKNEKNRIRIVSMSFRLPHDDVAVKLQIDNLNKQDVICIAGLGNDGHNASPGWPARYHNVVSVGSVDYSGGSSKFSNRFNEHMDVYAPGEDVLVAKNTGMCSGHQSNVTCVPLPPPPPPIPSEKNSETDTGVDIDMGVLAADSGTSFAAPAVAGLIAILVQWARLHMEDKPHLVESITRFDNLMKFLQKHMMVEIKEVPNAWLLQPEIIKHFFKEKIQHLDKLVEELD